MEQKLLKARTLGPIALMALITGCASSPLYTSQKSGNWTVGEIPRDARGEPVWVAIPPMPGQQQAAFSPPPAAALAAAPAATAEGDAEDFPRPRTE